MSTIASALVGEKFGILTVISVAKRTGYNGQAYLNCKCECGKEREVRRNNLTSGSTKSCGCSHKRTVNSKKVNFVISNRPGESASVSADKKELGKKRRRIEEIKDQQALERELSAWP